MFEEREERLAKLTQTTVGFLARASSLRYIAADNRLLGSPFLSTIIRYFPIDVKE